MQIVFRCHKASGAGLVPVVKVGGLEIGLSPQCRVPALFQRLRAPFPDETSALSGVMEPSGTLSKSCLSPASLESVGEKGYIHTLFGGATSSRTTAVQPSAGSAGIGSISIPSMLRVSVVGVYGPKVDGQKIS